MSPRELNGQPRIMPYCRHYTGPEENHSRARMYDTRPHPTGPPPPLPVPRDSVPDGPRAGMPDGLNSRGPSDIGVVRSELAQTRCRLSLPGHHANSRPSPSCYHRDHPKIFKVDFQPVLSFSVSISRVNLFSSTSTYLHPPTLKH